MYTSSWNAKIGYRSRESPRHFNCKDSKDCRGGSVRGRGVGGHILTYQCPAHWSSREEQCRGRPKIAKFSAQLKINHYTTPYLRCLHDVLCYSFCYSLLLFLWLCQPFGKNEFTAGEKFCGRKV